MRRFSTRPAVFLFTRALATGDFREVRARVRRELAAPGRRTLDLGCGPGTFADLFAGEDYVGVDASRRHIDYARKGRPGAFLAGGLRQMELPEGRFDQALSYGLLEHLPDGPAQAALFEVRRVLVPGGRLLLIAEVPATGRLGRLVQALLGRVSRRPDAYRHLLAELGVVERLEAFRSGPTDFVAVLARRKALRAPPG
jgi:SAM-dependent methyltransferase